MPRGGVRPNSGPIKGTKYDKRTLARDLERAHAVKTAEQILGAGETPLEYMIRVMRDATADSERRDRNAKNAAEYCHCRKPQEIILQAEVHIDGVDIQVLGK